MILQGKNLYVMVDGVVLAGAKSCDVQVDCETIPVSSPSDGSWENSIAGRKSWSVTTNHLVLTRSVPLDITVPRCVSVTFSANASMMGSPSTSTRCILYP